MVALSDTGECQAPQDQRLLSTILLAEGGATPSLKRGQGDPLFPTALAGRDQGTPVEQGTCSKKLLNPDKMNLNMRTLSLGLDTELQAEQGHKGIFDDNLSLAITFDYVRSRYTREESKSPERYTAGRTRGRELTRNLGGSGSAANRTQSAATLSRSGAGGGQARSSSVTPEARPSSALGGSMSSLVR